MLASVTRAVVLSTCIWASYLITGVIEERALGEASRLPPLVATAAGMVALVALFAPLFAWADRVTQAVVRASLRHARARVGSWAGLALFVSAVTLLLYALLLRRWFDVSLWDVAVAAAAGG